MSVLDKINTLGNETESNAITPEVMAEILKDIYISSGNSSSLSFLEQDLTDEQKLQARKNIGAVGITVLRSIQL